MKYLCVWEFDPEGFDNILEKFGQALAEIKEKGTLKGVDAGKFPKSTGEGFLPIGKNICYSFYKANTAEQLTNLTNFWMPGEVKKIEWIPIISWSEFVESWENLKK